MYQATFALDLGATYAGLTLKAQLTDTSGVDTGAEITSGFVEIGGGNYIWTYASFADGFAGGIKILNDADDALLTFFTPDTLNTDSVNAIITAMFAKTGTTTGGTWTFLKAIKVLTALIAGKVRDKSGSTTVDEILDPEDGTTVIAELTLSETTPYRSLTIL